MNVTGFCKNGFVTLHNGNKFNIYWGHEKSVGYGKTGNLELNVHHPTALFFHGAGQSSFSWVTTFIELNKIFYARNQPGMINCIAVDTRGHGLTECQDETKLDKETLKMDFFDVLCSLVPESTNNHKIFLIGHSMGGAMACWLASHILNSGNDMFQVAGLFMMDIVEELAMSSLEHTKSLLLSRPQVFDTLDDAIHWSLSVGYLQNSQSASYSVPGQLRQLPNQKYTWRTDLIKSFDLWNTWFEGLSQEFVKVKLINKVILLAGTDRLDKTLIIGQMQGKFKLIVLPEVKVGHFVHEDAPLPTANALYSFFTRVVSL